MAAHNVVIFPEGIKVEAVEGSTLKDILHEAGVNFDFPCGGTGKCGKCRVRIVSGGNALGKQEESLMHPADLADGIRLACLVKVTGSTIVELLPEKSRRHKILFSSLGRKTQLKPHIIKKYVEVQKSDLEDSRPDLERLRDVLEKNGQAVSEIHFPVLKKLPVELRKQNFKVTAILHQHQLRGLEAGNTTDTLLGMAFDIGTTSIVGYLIDLYSGSELAVVSMLNPQTRFGGDVVSRITYANDSENGLNELQTTLTEAINELIGKAANNANVTRNDIYTLVMVGNTCMHHLFLGINPRQLALAPYAAAVSEPVDIEPADLRLEINPAGKVLLLPNVAGFVGADTVGVLLATELDKSEKTKLIVDIGTNGELVLGNKEGLVACSAAAGPAFEGAQISCGMRGTSGAIDHVTFGDSLEVSVIDHVDPLGICGSALLDTVAGLVETGLITETGKFIPPDKITNPAGLKLKERIVKCGESWAFLLAEGGEGTKIMVTQKDIRELQLAKGALATGIRILMDHKGLKYDDIDEVLLAGAFGNYLNPHSACAIGLIPPELESRILMIGNAAVAGAKLSLVSLEEYERAEKIAQKVSFIELGSDSRFTEIFADSMIFPTHK
ncbi:ASKHA domain-containing protein [Dethiobacter alkaliphilus]|uniref:ASKHA domain-containing protein n=1 Tax=Dethiobacter alkaliphilus TaxID=427926 RepID=UPI002226654A|nr:ASKHA domain-containing protein [Dethiobacter alkaliphilus]MCW3490012.1 ASKHA domain-containing protein [Dethiobacter alkaliphilus]